MTTTATKLTGQEKAEAAFAALLYLKRFCPKGTRLYYDIKKATNGGTFHTVFYVASDGDIYRITAQLARVFGYRYNPNTYTIVTRGESPATDLACELGRKLHDDPRSITAVRV